ncbi:pectin acetylesterase-family hydrolase [Chondromyces apiculatus]|uniref:Pectinacetylesterase n=1 Tax=Chondromyces apiculatus DSM 436 TaxID=1192034 RepID=A0A017T280_9BACT|nr:pectin acetylesterase-family hydrolase [Chondromyces apiculatus]EYF03062.1 Hypothetical protein CAP_6176 [Chondromyces apiculatus DSM 436]
MRTASVLVGCLLALPFAIAACSDGPVTPAPGTETSSGSGANSGTGGSGGDDGTGGSGASSSQGGGGTGGEGGEGGASACTPEGPFDGDPINATPETWTWVGVPEAHCRNRSETGFGIRLNPASDKLVIFLEGGGACFNGATCLANPQAYTEQNFNTWKGGNGPGGILDNDNDDNPVRDWNMVFVPYCTGDVHSGNATGVNVPGLGAPQNQSFVGYANIGHYLRRIIPTLPELSQVLLTGTSAGGFGAAFNYDRVAQAFCPTPVTLVDDSGPVMSDEYLAPCLQQRWRTLWGLDGTLPADCAECTPSNGGGLLNYTVYLGSKYPERRLGLISSLQDNTIRTFYSYGNNNCAGIEGLPGSMTGAAYTAGLTELRDDYLTSTTSWASYYMSGTAHTILGGNGYYSTTVAGVSLTGWVASLLDEAPATHVSP